MTSANFKEQTIIEVREHPNYGSNLNWGSKFTNNYNATHGGRYFTLRVSNNSDGVKFYFSFAFIVPVEDGLHPAFGNPVNPNQDYENFMKEFKGTFCAYSKMQKRWDEKLSNIQWVKEKFISGKIYSNFRCEIDANSIIFSDIMDRRVYAFSDHGFKERIMNLLK